MAHIKELFSNDKIFLESKKIPYKHQPEFDLLDSHCYGFNQRINMENLDQKNNLFRQLQRQARGQSVFCKNIKVAFNIKCDWISRKTACYMYTKWTKITDLSKNKHQPISLQNIAAAASIKKLIYFESHILFAVFNMVKNKQIFIRAGPDHERKVYNFANIIKNFMYKIEYEPIVSLEYFDHVTLNPAPFCIHCGLFKKIEISMCWCNLCNFLRFACVFTINIEKPYHAN